MPRPKKNVETNPEDVSEIDETEGEVETNQSTEAPDLIARRLVKRNG